VVEPQVLAVDQLTDLRMLVLVGHAERVVGGSLARRRVGGENFTEKTFADFV
jgi:hypothetical protein